jgi:sugar phosphate permease
MNGEEVAVAVPDVSKTDSKPIVPTYGPNYKWYVVAMLWGISFFNYADRQAIFSVFSLLAVEMHLSKVDQGALGSSFAIVYGLAAPFAGILVDRIRRKDAILGGLHIWSLICLATAASRRFSHLLFFRAAEGLGESLYYPAATSMLSDYHGRTSRSRALGLHQTSVYAGTIAGGFFAGLIGEKHGWRGSFIVFGTCGVLLGIVLFRFLNEPQRGAAEPDQPNNAKKPAIREVLLAIVRSPTVLTLMAAFACANFVAMVLLSWMPNYLSESFELSLAMAGLAATAFAQIASLVGAIVGGWLADRWRQRSPGGRMLIQAVGVFCGAPFVYWCGVTLSIPWLFVALTAWGFFKGLYDANIFASVFDVVRPEYRGSVAGLMNLVGWLGGGASAPMVVGYLAESHGLGWAIASTAIVYIASGGLLLLAGLVFVRRELARK